MGNKEKGGKQEKKETGKIQCGEELQKVSERSKKGNQDLIQGRKIKVIEIVII